MLIDVLDILERGEEAQAAGVARVSLPQSNAFRVVSRAHVRRPAAEVASAQNLTWSLALKPLL